MLPYLCPTNYTLFWLRHWMEIDSLKSKFNSSNSTNDTDCLKILAEELDTCKVATISVCSTASVACILAVIFILASKVYKKFVYRLTLYMIIVALVHPVVLILDVLRTTCVPQWNCGGCEGRF